MNAMKTPARIATVALALTCAWACSTTPTTDQAESSVRPGINDNFLDPELDVGEFTDRFEGESREVAVQRDAIARELHLQPGEAVADVGAGTGLFMEPLAAAVTPTGTVYAVDISPSFIDHLRARARENGLEQVQVVLCDERSVALPPASVDVVFVCDTYHHFEYPRSTLASIRSSLRSGGRLVIVDFERIPGVSREWTLDHVRAGKEEVRAEVEAAGFQFRREATGLGLEENYVVEFVRP